MLMQDPFFWAALTGVGVGFSANVATRFRVAPLRRWTLALFTLSGAICAALAGVLLSDAEQAVSLPVLYMLAGSVVLSTPAFRFPRAVGLPFLAVVLGAALVFVFTLRNWNVHEPGRPVLEFSALNVDEDGIEVEFSTGSEVRVELVEETVIDVELEVLRSNEYWFFFDSYVRVRKPGFQDRSDLSARLDSLPGWELELVSGSAFTPRELYVYRVFLSPAGDLRYEMAVPGS